MIDTASMRRLQGSKLRYRETDDEFLVVVPGRPDRAAARAAPLIALFALAIGILVYFQPPLLVSVVVVMMLAAFLLMWLLILVGPHLATAVVQIGRVQMTLKQSAYGQEEITELDLDAGAYARQHSYHSRHHRRRFRHGIDIVSGDDVVHFGDRLRRGELDWLQWRINRFLGHPTVPDHLGNGVLQVEALPNEATPAPRSLTTRVEAGASETRFTFPNSFQRRSYKGVGMIVFGLALAGFFLHEVFPRRGGVIEPVEILPPAAFSLAGAFLCFGGLVRMFGLSRLTISPDFIRFQSTLFGMGPRWKLPTRNVLVVGGPRDAVTRSGEIIGSAKECVIRTATKQISYGDALRDAERNTKHRDWVRDEIALRIYAVLADGLGQAYQDDRRQRLRGPY